MASDAQVREVESLYMLRSDILNAVNSLRSSLSSAAQRVNSESSELMGLFNEVDARCERCKDEYYAAQQEYDYYCSQSSSDPDYSSYTESQLRQAVENARTRMNQAIHDFYHAQNLISQAQQVLSSIQSLAQSGAVSIDSEASGIASAIERAAYEIDKYTQD